MGCRSSSTNALPIHWAAQAGPAQRADAVLSLDAHDPSVQAGSQLRARQRTHHDRLWKPWPQRSVRFMQILPAIAVDVICITVFAIVGRSSHQEATDLLGVAHTAWPFLAGCLVGRSWAHLAAPALAEIRGRGLAGHRRRRHDPAAAHRRRRTAVVRHRGQLRTRPVPHRLARGLRLIQHASARTSAEPRISSQGKSRWVPRPGERSSL